ncbi:MAG: hypothetical protein H6828_06835 [Planctomycetes bacterium]|nr:hypothetical protein [Planctomycetota bacterium]
MPAHERVGRDQGRDAGEGLAAEHLRAHGEPAALVVGEAQAAWTELLAQHAVLLDEVGDAVCLLAVDEAGDGEEEGAKGVRGCGHRLRVEALAEVVYRR